MIDDAPSVAPLSCQNINEIHDISRVHSDSITDVKDAAFPIKKPTKTYRIKPRDVNLALTYRNYARHPVELKTYRIAELKTIAKHNRLHITGNKTVLVERIENCFRSHVSAERIQQTMRRFFVHRSFALRGKAFRDRSQCVNETDFYTMEPLTEIPWQSFFSYTDDANFTYGFNLCSLMTLLSRKGRSTTNPYNRAVIPENVVGQFIRLYLYMITLFPEHVNPEDLLYQSRNTYVQPVADISALVRGHYYGFYPAAPSRLSNHLLNMVDPPVHLRFDDEGEPSEHRRPRRPTGETLRRGATTGGTGLLEQLRDVVGIGGDVAPTNRTEPTREGGMMLAMNMIEHNNNTALRMQVIRMKPLMTRVQELFMEMDQLGNYTDSRWFLDLNKRQCFHLYGHLYDYWRFRNRLSPLVKQRICPLGDPFNHVMPVRFRMDEVSEEQLQRGCVTVMENMIYTAYDIEDRRLGTLHVLLSMTVVSTAAQAALLWLYESLH